MANANVKSKIKKLCKCLSEWKCQVNTIYTVHCCFFSMFHVRREVYALKINKWNSKDEDEGYRSRRCMA
jgi:hypothetical protein